MKAIKKYFNRNKPVKTIILSTGLIITHSKTGLITVNTIAE